jgi:hypothetical protein
MRSGTAVTGNLRHCDDHHNVIVARKRTELPNVANYIVQMFVILASPLVFVLEYGTNLRHNDFVGVTQCP